MQSGTGRINVNKTEIEADIASKCLVMGSVSLVGTSDQGVKTYDVRGCLYPVDAGAQQGAVSFYEDPDGNCHYFRPVPDWFRQKVLAKIAADKTAGYIVDAVITQTFGQQPIAYVTQWKTIAAVVTEQNLFACLDADGNVVFELRS